jgi:hypothetical protein
MAAVPTMAAMPSMIAMPTAVPAMTAMPVAACGGGGRGKKRSRQKRGVGKFLQHDFLLTTQTPLRRLALTMLSSGEGRCVAAHSVARAYARASREVGRAPLLS